MTSALQRQIHALAVEKGWWEGNQPVGEKLMLVVTEIAEAMEEYRNGKGLTTVYKEPDGKPCGFPIELADAAIRLMDMAESFGIDLEGMIILKHDYNKQRAWKHGGKDGMTPHPREIIEAIRIEFIGAIEKKNSWGKNEIRLVFDNAVANALLRFIT